MKENSLGTFGKRFVLKTRNHQSVSSIHAIHSSTARFHDLLHLLSEGSHFRTHSRTFSRKGELYNMYVLPPIRENCPCYSNNGIYFFIRPYFFREMAGQLL